MRKKVHIAVIAFILGLGNLYAQENFKVMFLNLLNFPQQDVPSNRIQYLEVFLTDYAPDIFMVCELNNEQAGNDILSVLQTNLGISFDMAEFVNNTSDDNTTDQNDLQNLLFYDSSKFILEFQTEVTTIFRDFNHYQLKLNTIEQDNSPILLDVIIGHLKASDGIDNELFRLQMVNDLVDYVATLPADSNIVLGADLNMYTSAELGWMELTDPNNNITFTDPADRVGSWHTNPEFLDMFTQSTRTGSELGGASGGFDDRFDFILTSENMLTNTDIFFVENSYKVYGNNNNPNCFNQAVNTVNCSGAEYSAFIREALYNFSDHLPVTITLQTNQNLGFQDFATAQPLEFIGTNMVGNTLRLKFNNESISNQTLKVYDSIGKLIKTINAQNSIYIHADVSNFANGIYYIVTETTAKPLKFVVAH